MRKPARTIGPGPEQVENRAVAKRVPQPRPAGMSVTLSVNIKGFLDSLQKRNTTETPLLPAHTDEEENKTDLD